MMMTTLQALSFTIMVATGVLLWVAESGKPFFTRNIDRGRHGAVNLGLAAINLLILVPSTLFTAASLREASFYWQGIQQISMPWWLHTLLSLMLIDLWMYFWHRLNHESAFFWNFHSIHHSDPAIDVTSALRFHFLEILLSEPLRLCFLLIIGARFEDLLLYNILMTPVIQFHHSNVSIPENLDRLLRIAIPTPLMHRLHHSVRQTDHNSNYGSLLSIWDRIFNSCTIRAVGKTMPLGLAAESAEEQQTLQALLTRPFSR